MSRRVRSRRHRASAARRAAACLAAGLLAAGLGVPGVARAQAFHALSPAQLPAAPIEDLVVRGGTGWAVTWDGTTATVYPVTFSTTAPPSVGATADASFPSVAVPDLAYDGALVLVATSGGLHRRDATGAWTVPSLAGLSARDVGLDASGSVGTAAISSLALPGVGNMAHSANGGASWTAATAGNGTSTYQRVAVWGQGIVLVPYGVPDTLMGSTDGGLTWTPLQAGATGLDATSDVLATASGYLVVGPGGALFTTPDAGTTVTDHTDPGGPAFVRVGDDGTLAWILDASGGLWDVDPAAPSWPASAPFVTPVTTPLALSVDGPDQILVAGQVGGAPALVWRNRPPVVSTPPAATSLTEGDAGVDLTVAGADPDGDPITAAWTCPGLAGASFSPATGLTSHLTVADDPAFCPADPAKVVDCTVTLADPEPRTSAPGTFQVTVAGADSTAPTVPVPGISPSGQVTPGTAMSVNVAATDACGIHGYAWEVLDPSGKAVPGLTGTGATFAFAAPPVIGGAPTTYQVHVTVTDPSGNSASNTASFTVVPAAPEITVVCPTSLPAGKTTTVTATPTAASGPVTSIAWTPAPPGTADVATKLAADGSLELTPDACAPAGTVDITATATGPGGTSQVVTCQAVPVVPGPHAPSVDVPASLTVPLGPTGGQATLTATVGSGCAGATLSLSWDLSGIPAAARPASPPTGGAPGAYDLPISVAPGDVATVLGGASRRQGTIGLTVTDDAGGTPVTKTIPVYFVAQVKITVDLSIPGRRSVAPGDLVRVRATIHPDMRVPLGDLNVELGVRGLDPAWGTEQLVTGGCAGGKPRFYQDTNDAPALELGGAGDGCDPTVSFLARRGFGPASLTVTRCFWPGGAQVPCSGNAVKIARGSVVGCSATGGPAGWGSLLALLGLGALGPWRRRRRG